MSVPAEVVKVEPAPRPRIQSIAGAYAKLDVATRDLFRLNGGQSIPVEARLPEPGSGKATAAAEARAAGQAAPAPAKPPEATAPAPEAPSSSSARKPEASVMFSLQELMKAAGPTTPQPEDDSEQQLWNMQAATPLFGTSHDQALLTTPLEPLPKSSSMDSMTMSSRRSAGRRLPLWIAIASGCTVALGVAGWWVLRPVDSSAADASGDSLPAVSAPADAVRVASPPGAEPVAAAPDPAPAPAPAPVEPVPPAAAEPEQSAPAEAAGDDTTDEPRSRAGADPEPARAPSSRRPAPPKRKPVASKAPPFSVAAAKKALSAAAAKAAKCGGGSGQGKIQLTFATSGKVSNAHIAGGPFSAASATGKCALRHFKAARVPAFSGTPQTVAKSFKVK